MSVGALVRLCRRFGLVGGLLIAGGEGREEGASGGGCRFSLVRDRASLAGVVDVVGCSKGRKETSITLGSR